MKKRTTIAAGVLALLVVAGGTTGAMSLHRSVTLSVEGESRPASAFGVTVADVLSANGVTLTDYDLVQPAADAPIADGQTIIVSYGKPLTLYIDGQEQQFVSTQLTLDAALRELPEVALPDLEDVVISVPLTTALPRTGLEVTVTTLKDVTLSVHGESKTVTTTGATVADLLAEQQITLSADDKLSPDAATPITDALTIKIDVVQTTTKSVTETIAFKTVTQSDASMFTDETKTITKGVNGSAKRTYAITIVNGKETEKKLVSETIIKAPVDKVVKKGTKSLPAPASSGKELNLAREAMWDRIAKCESGNRWNINTGNGYYGGLQFNLATWRSVNGQDFAARPDLATRAEQITVANRLYAKRGLQPWGCRGAA